MSTDKIEHLWKSVASVSKHYLSQITQMSTDKNNHLCKSVASVSKTKSLTDYADEHRKKETSVKIHGICEQNKN
jgi:hypothetical protein